MLVVKVVLVLLHVVTLAPKGFGEFEGCGDCGSISWTACVGCESRGVLPRILDRGVPRRFVNPNPI